MDNIGDRIKEKRKELGLTQLELANKINVTDRAVSKWEQNEGNPDISILPNLAEIFDVSLDYLMTGKSAEEKIVTMSKIELCAKKDSPALLESFDLSSKDEDGKGLWYYIIKYDSINVFNTLIQKKKATQILNFNNRRLDSNDHIANIIYFLIVTNNLSEINQFDFSDIGFANPNELNDKALNALMGDKRVKETTRNYLLTSHKREMNFNGNGNYINSSSKIKGNTQILYPYLLSKAIDFKEWKFADEVLNAIADANLYIGDLTEKKKINRDDQNFRQSDINRKILLMFKPTDKPDYNEKELYEYAINIEKGILISILNAHKYDLLDKANNICRKIKMDTISKRDIELDKIENSSKSETEKLKFRAINNYIVIPSILDQTEDLKLIREIIDNNYYHYYEFVYDCLTKKKQKILYKFFIDNNLEMFADKLTEGTKAYSSLLADSWTFFISQPNDINYKEHKELFAAQNDITEVINDLQKRNRSFDNLELYKLMDNPVIANIKEIKERIYTKVNDRIEAKKQAEIDKIERAKIVKGLTKDYFYSLLKNNGKELFIIKLCALLDAIFRFDYKYEGDDYFARLNTHIKNGPKSRNCDDGWGYMVKDTKYDTEVVFPWQRTADMLNRLRIQRNNIAHSESDKVEELTDDELKECLEYVFSINKAED